MRETVDVLISASGAHPDVRAQFDETGIAVDVPPYAHPGDAGADLTSIESVTLAPGERATVGTGVAIALPDGYAAFVVPRSGMAARHGITIVNSPGTVDAGYRGEIRVTLHNTDTSTPFVVSVGDRIAQIIVMPVAHARFVPVATLPGSHRGEGGFGSTADRRTRAAPTRPLPMTNQTSDSAAPDDPTTQARHESGVTYESGVNNERQ